MGAYPQEGLKGWIPGGILRPDDAMLIGIPASSSTLGDGARTPGWIAILVVAPLLAGLLTPMEALLGPVAVGCQEGYSHTYSMLQRVRIPYSVRTRWRCAIYSV